MKTKDLAFITAVGSILSTAEDYGRGPYRAGPEHKQNPRLHHTKPWESTADARARKKAERQRKKKARNEKK